MFGDRGDHGPCGIILILLVELEASGQARQSAGQFVENGVAATAISEF